MEYYVYKLTHDRGIKFGKTSGSSKQSVMDNITDYELCPESAVKIKKIPLSMFSFPADQLWKLYTKQYIVKMIDRQAVQIISYIDGYSARIKYIQTGQECTVSRSVIREFTPKTKK